MKTGYIQTVHAPGTIKKTEANKVIVFKGRIDLLRKLFTAYNCGCYKLYVFFDQPKIKTNDKEPA